MIKNIPLFLLSFILFSGCNSLTNDMQTNNLQEENNQNNIAEDSNIRNNENILILKT